MFTLRNPRYRDVQDESADIIADFKDHDGDDCMIEAMAGGELIEISTCSDTGCIVLERDAAIQFANQILEFTKVEGE
ncbi:hypothetical protein NJH77_21405 [Serratia fonticola]|uniref:hypothetical protein n=1 Tax=Serratia fonticola TaxID=47917 RepID=UPI00209848B4|nr:hypothetical protein [Serratia fonticola]MCO7511811.1 hypothetical protein [Serratia fonticola]